MGTSSPGIPFSPAVTSTVVRKLRAPVARALAAAPAVNAPAASAAGQTAAAAQTPAAATTSTAAPPPISEADFMKLFVAQLQHQDPMNPLQPDQLASQLAQFTSVQELAQLDADSTNQIAAMATNTQAIEANMATALIGRPVVALGNGVDVSASSTSTKVMADIGAGGGQAVLTLTNAQGQTVGTYKLGTVSGGTHQILSFDSRGLAAGPYNFSISVASASGASVPVTTYMAGTVTGVDVSTGTPSLVIGDLMTPVSNLVEVLPTGAAGSASSTSQEITKQ